jgi:hypothetical protein
MKYLAKSQSIFSIGLLILLVSLTSFYQVKNQEPIHQLRIYQIPKNNRQAFHERFEQHALRIMKKYNFHVVSTWETTFEDKLEFVYLLQWRDEQTMKTAWTNFLADQEWKNIKEQTSREHGTFVENIEDRTLTVTSYSPAKNLIH